MNTTFPRLYRGACAPTPAEPSPKDKLIAKIKQQVADLRAGFDPEKLVELYRLVEELN